MRTWMAVAVVTAAAVYGCAAANGRNEGAGQGGGTASGIGADSGLPCDVADFLSAYCTSCHGATPIGGAPMSLVSYAELTAASKSKPSESYAAYSLERIQDGTMPPGGGVTASEYAAFAAWVSAGTPVGACGGGVVDAGPVDTTFTGPSTCAGTLQAATCHESASMNPGMPCLSCHSDPSKFSPPCGSGGGDDDDDTGPSYAVAGTVFALGHVPDNCNPSSAQAALLTQATVILTGADGVETTLTVNSVGNFHADKHATLALPYHAKVVAGGKTRAMSAAQSDGDCNGCHTETGAQNAPGRIALPQ